MIRLQDEKGICLLLEQVYESVEAATPQIVATFQAAGAVVPSLVKEIRESHSGKDSD